MIIKMKKLSGQFTDINVFLIESATDGNLEGVKLALDNGADLSKDIEWMTIGGTRMSFKVFDLAIDFTRGCGRYEEVSKYLEGIYKL